MSAWISEGYPIPNLFAGANQCRFRMCHTRPDGLAIMTVGDQRARGGRLEPVTTGFNFLTFVAVCVNDETGEMVELDRAAANDHRTAAAQHIALLQAWAERPIPEHTS